MDLATLLGLVIGLGFLFIAALWEGGFDVGVTVGGLAKPTAAMIVFGGTFGATMVSYPLSTFLMMPKLMGRAFNHKEAANPAEIVELFCRLAEKARREGLLSLESETATINDKFLQKGIMLVVDGQDPEVVREILEVDVEQMQKRHADKYNMFTAMGGFAPTMGIIGTVMGLIEVLRSMEDPGELGPKVAVAFVATFYGIFSANILWIPIGAKLKVVSEDEIQLRHMMVEGILGVQAGENPRIIKEKLEAFLPPKMRKVEDTPAAATAEANAA